MNYPNIKDLIHGNLKKKQFGPVFVIMLTFLIGGWSIARAFYLGNPVYPYFMEQNKISTQGNLGKNPIGGWFFIISTIIVGLLLITYFAFLTAQLQHLTHGYLKHSRLLGVFRFFGTLGGIGLIFVAITPEGSDLPFDFLHGTGEAMGFGGLGLACFLSFGLLFNNVRRNAPWPANYQVLAFALLLSHFIIMIAFTDSDSVIQWTGFYTVLIWCVGLFLILPEEPSEHSKE